MIEIWGKLDKSIQFICVIFHSFLFNITISN